MIARRSVAGYSLHTAPYLESVGVPPAVIRPRAYGLEGPIDKDLCVRNTLQVYTRKPARR